MINGPYPVKLAEGQLFGLRSALEAMNSLETMIGRKMCFYSSVSVEPIYECHWKCCFAIKKTLGEKLDYKFITFAT